MEKRLLGSAMRYLLIYYTHATKGGWPEEAVRLLMDIGFLDEEKNPTNKFHEIVDDFIATYGDRYIDA